MTRIKGTVKWFSNKKGYGFIEPSDGNEDVFVHQSNVTSDGYRTLIQGWEVEFDTMTDSDGKIKAENVTAPGGGPCTGPRRQRKNENSSTSTSNGNKNGSKEKQWHFVLEDSVKEALTTKSIRHSTGTIDVSKGPHRIKLGTRGYVSMAHEDALLAEGTFESDAGGVVVFTWQHAIRFENGEWNATTTDSLISTLTLSHDDVIAVGSDETPDSLWGEGKTDPRDALEANGFLMRRVMLTPKLKQTDNGGAK